MSTSSKLDRIKEIILNASKEGQKDTAEAIDTGNFNMYPYEAASGRGLLAALEAADVASAPDEEDLKGMREAMYGDANSDKPVFLPMMGATISPKIKGTAFGKRYNLKGGEMEDELLRRPLELGGAYRGTTTGHGLVIQDRLGTDNPRLIAEKLLGNQKGLGGFTLEANPRKFQALEKASGVTPGTSAGFFDPMASINPNLSRDAAIELGKTRSKIAVDTSLNNKLEEIASTIRHEQGHANDFAKGIDKFNETIPTSLATPGKVKSIRDLAGKDFAREVFLKDKQLDYSKVGQKINEFVAQGKFKEALQLENAIKQNHFNDFQNLEAEDMLNVLLKNYSENPTPESTELIRKVYPRFDNILRKKK